jgi:hypothetical protein
MIIIIKTRTITIITTIMTIIIIIVIMIIITIMIIPGLNTWRILAPGVSTVRAPPRP